MRLKEVWLSRPIYINGYQNQRWMSAEYDIEIDDTLIFITHNASSAVCITPLANMAFAIPLEEAPAEVIEIKPIPLPVKKVAKKKTK